MTDLALSVPLPRIVDAQSEAGPEGELRDHKEWIAPKSA